MNSEEYERLNHIDQEHWFYRAKRTIVRHWLERHVELHPDDLLIDAGMGTGVWLAEMGQRCRVLGLDDHEESIRLAQPRLQTVGGQALQTSLDAVGLPSGCATAITMLDVLEHMDDDAGALREMIRLTRPGGVLIITVPALRWLWSDWDVVLHHRRRYHYSDLLQLVRQPGVELLHCAYFNSLMLPPIALVRCWRRLRPPAPGAARMEDQIPGQFLNSLLYHLMVKPACWSWFRPPLGVSLLAVLRRVAATERRADAPGSWNEHPCRSNIVREREPINL
ncbi:MAG: class I SAM-dependent methyltransferase [Gemmataceae bacterium]